MASWNPTLKIPLPKLAQKAYPVLAQQRAARAIAQMDEFTRLFGNAVIEEIRTRTEERSIDKNGRPFPAYSKQYMGSLAFQVYGKSEKVNLHLTGEMLAAMRARRAGQDLVIDFVGDDNRAKAQGHISGKYGNSSKIKKRDFLGLPDGKMLEIFRQSIGQMGEDIPDVDIEVDIGNAVLALEVLDLLN